MTIRNDPTVLFISPTAETGGSDQALLRIVRDMRMRGYACHVVTPAASPLADELAAAGARLHVVPMRRLTGSGGASWWLRYALEWPLAVGRLVGVSRRVRADVIASNSLHSWYGWAVAALTRRPHVWHAREIVVQSQSALWVERQLLARFADLVVACSQAVADQFVDVVNGSRLQVVHEDVDRAIFSPDRQGRFRRQVGIQPDVPLAAFVGRVDTWKGLDRLLDARPTVRGACPDGLLVAAGVPVIGKESYYRQRYESAERAGGVLWLGPQSGDTIADLMADFAVPAAPSAFPEPYGLVLVEALASGATVVVTANGGAPEIVGKAQPSAGRLLGNDDPEALAAALREMLQFHGPHGHQHTRRALIAPFPVDWASVYGRVRPGRPRETQGS